jgi:hypothetical protein
VAVTPFAWLIGDAEPDNGMLPLQDAAGIAVVDFPRGLAGQWNDVQASNALYYVVEFNALPEPSCIGLLLMGLLGLAAYRGRRCLR